SIEGDLQRARWVVEYRVSESEVDRVSVEHLAPSGVERSRFAGRDIAPIDLDDPGDAADRLIAVGGPQSEDRANANCLNAVCRVVHADDRGERIVVRDELVGGEPQGARRRVRLSLVLEDRLHAVEAGVEPLSGVTKVQP